MEKPKRGRPPKDPESVRSGVYQLRLTDSEREAYDRAAKRDGVGLSEWIRRYLDKAAGVKPKKA